MHLQYTISAIVCALLCAFLLSSCLSSAARRDRRIGEKTPRPEYIIQRLPEGVRPAMDADWEGAVWNETKAASLSYWLRTSTWRDGRYLFKLRYDDDYIYGIVQARDRYVVATHARHDTNVCQDTCAEIFLSPSEKGYVNTEMSVSGARLVQFRTSNPEWRPGLKGVPRWKVRMGDEVSGQFESLSSIQKLVNPEYTDPYIWVIEFRLPVKIFRELMKDPSAPLAGQVWRGNVYHCADYSSHPRHVCWAPTPIVNFHMPDYFGYFIFE